MLKACLFLCETDDVGYQAILLYHKGHTYGLVTQRSWVCGGYVMKPQNVITARNLQQTFYKPRLTGKCFSAKLNYVACCCHTPFDFCVGFSLMCPFHKTKFAEAAI